MFSIFPEDRHLGDTWSVKVSSLGIRFLLTSKKGRRKREEFWALRDISFEVERGEVFGIIGSNGSGKSTLLKIIAGIYPATRGKVEVKGTIAPLIELGASFNPELSGAENIYLAGSIYRIPKKVIQERFDQIVEFSGLRKFIYTPVKNYSSGMFIRLAFSIIIFFEPDVLLIDEIFAVGDRVFQQKSFEKILSFREKGASLLIVSHDMNLIKQLCQRVAVLSRGRLSFLGKPEEAVNHYLDLIKKGEGLEEAAPIAPASEESFHADARRWGNRQVEITRVEFVDEAGRPKEVFRTGDYFEARISFINHGVEEIPVFGVAIYTIYRLLIYGPNTLDQKLGTHTFFPGSEEKPGLFRDPQLGTNTFYPQLPEEGDLFGQSQLPPQGTVRFIIDSLPLLKGDYLFSASVYDSTLTTAYDHHEMMYLFRVESPGVADFGTVRLDCRWLLSSE